MNEQVEYIFIAKGIGITPFRSMIRYLMDKNIKKNITLFYIAAKDDEFLFTDIFSKAEKEIGLKTVYLTREEIDEAKLKEHTQSYMTATYYLSGPQETIEAYREMLFKLGIDNSQIKTDLFTGY